MDKQDDCVRSAGKTIGGDAVALLLLLLVAVAARFATFGNPVIGFDEQFYLLVGDRMLNGAVPFVDIFDRKPLGLFLLYAAIRLLGGDGFLAYKLVALLFVVGTAFAIFLIARRRTGSIGALAAAALYICWLNFMEGEGGQAPIFYNLPVAGAVLITLAAIGRPERVRSFGCGAMLLVGLAMQIKYSVVFEGIFLGCALIWFGWQAGQRGSRIAWSILLWIGCAMAPTLAALAAYALHGHFSEFWFANFVSVFAQKRGDVAVQMIGLAVIVGILLPLLLLLATAPRVATVQQPGAERRVLKGWLVAAMLGVLIFWRFASPHYAMPILPPLLIAMAPALDGSPRRRILALILVGVAFGAGQVALALTERAKGGAAAARAVATAADHRGGCIFVYDGYPALYMLTQSCLPTRWAFPGSLNTADEANPAALGIDPAREVARIMATMPAAVIDDYPRFDQGNRATRAVVDRALAADYFLSACVPTGSHRVRLIYRPLAEGRRQPSGACPTAAALGNMSGRPAATRAP
jgi:4-amino-4-deoxy-L-arabinose transferase-like glycosyltransferase